jgi:hypothetical protein
MLNSLFSGSVCVKEWNGKTEDEAKASYFVAAIPGTHFFLETFISPELYKKFKFSSESKKDIALELAEMMEQQGFDISDFTRLKNQLCDKFCEAQFEKGPYETPISVYIHKAEATVFQLTR